MADARERGNAKVLFAVAQHFKLRVVVVSDTLDGVASFLPVAGVEISGNKPVLVLGHYQERHYKGTRPMRSVDLSLMLRSPDGAGRHAARESQGVSPGDAPPSSSAQRRAA